VTPTERGAARWAGVAAWAGLAAALVIAFLLRRPNLTSPAPLGFDEGAFGASVTAMLHGELPYREVYSSQGPLFLPLLWFADLVTPWRWGARLVPVAAGLALVVIVHRLTAKLGDSAGALLASLIVATSSTLLFTTGAIEADGVAAAFGAAAVLTATRRERPRTILLVGLAAGAALAVKSELVVPPVAAALFVVWRRWGTSAAATAGAIAAAVVLALSLPWGIGRVWEQYVTLHLDARGRFQGSEFQPGGNFRLLRIQLYAGERPLLALAALAIVAAVAVAVAERRRPKREGPLVTAVWLWAALAAAVLLLHAPLFTQHLTVLIVPAAVLVGCYRPPLVAVAAVLLLVVPAQAERSGWRLSDREPSPEVAIYLRTLGALQPPGAAMLADEPGLAWLSGRRIPGDLVDPSFVRIATGALTTDDALAAATDPDVCAVLLWTGRFESLPGFREGLVAAGYTAVLGEGGHLLFLREGCSLPPGGGT
jgi:4-amino-4-deoxy-L-arabinose transferase-like glycosyltransferase